MEGALLGVIIAAASCIAIPLLLCFFHRAIVAPFLRSWYPGISPLFAWQPVPLLQKEQLTNTEEPIFRLVFGLPPGVHLKADLSLGEFVRVLVPGRRKPRSYSPMRVDRAGQFELCIKRYCRGHASNHLCNLSEGNSVLMSGPYPPFWIPLARRGCAKRIGLVAFGVGISEALPIARHEACKGGVEVRLLWANRSPEDVCLLADLTEIQTQAKGCFRIVHIFSRPKGELPEGALRGRISETTLRDVFNEWLDHKDGTYFLAIGTPAMIRNCYTMLAQLGFSQRLLCRRPCGCCFRRSKQ